MYLDENEFLKKFVIRPHKKLTLIYQSALRKEGEKS